MPPNPSFSTERLLIRASDLSDVDNLIALNDLETQLLRTKATPVPYGRTMAEEAISFSSKRFFSVSLVLKSDPSVFVGQMGLNSVDENHKNRDVALAIFLVPSMRGQGYGTEAMTWLLDWAFDLAGMHRVSLETGSDIAIAAYKKVGFVQEGVKRKCNWVNGEWKDTVCMGILSDEWKKQQVV